MDCPICETRSFIITKTRGASTLLGAGAGGFAAATSGAKAGAVAGNMAGKLIDENVWRMYRCSNCKHQWRIL